MNVNAMRASLKWAWGMRWLVCFGLAPVSGWGAVVHVKTNGNDALPGTSWQEAKKSVGAAIAAASGETEIWVAAGTYSGHWTLKPGLQLYGGFQGHETALAERNWRTNLSVLWGTTNRAVITVTNSGPNTRLDGFTIGGGNGIHGGGIAMVGSGPVIANNVIRNNMTDGVGAGISVWGFQLVSSLEAYFPHITNNIIVENQSLNSEGDGAGIGVVGSSPLIAWNVIARNTATRNGGGIACWRHSLPIIANNFIQANSASYDEMTLSTGGGGIFCSATDLDGRPISGAVSAPLILNNVISANGARHGGGMVVIDSLIRAATILNNTVVANNGAGIFWANTWPTNANNVVAFNAVGFERGLAGTSDAVIQHNNVFGNSVLGVAADYRGTADRSGTNGNLAADPQFANGALGDYHLQPGSPCVNAGSAALAITDLPDLDGETRVQGGTIDIGADESAGTPWSVPTRVVRVSPAGDDTDGLTWATAKRTIAGGIARAATTGGEVWVADGIYPEHVVLPAYVFLYGGFAGMETTRTARNPAAHPTVVDGSGVPTLVYFRNAGYRVSGIDGFTLQNGGTHTGGYVLHPDLTNRFGARGGAIYCRVSGPIVAGNLVRSNSIGSPVNAFESYGGGFYGYLAHAVIRSNTFFENEVLNSIDGSGGGVHCYDSMLTMENNVFDRNHAKVGAAICGMFADVRITGNVVRSNALYSGYPYQGSGSGAVCLRSCFEVVLDRNTFQGNISATGAGLSLESCLLGRVENNLFLNNLAWDYSGFGQGGMGGGMYVIVPVNSTGTLAIAHNTLVGNQAPATFMPEMGGAIALTLFTNKVALANNLIAFNSSGIWRDWRQTTLPVLLNNCLFNTTNYLYLPPGASDIQSDPLFVDRAAGDFTLLAASPCIDAGQTSFAALIDKQETARPLDGNNNGIPGFDIGAYEFVHPLADTDGDTQPDAAEVVAGTDPTNPTSTLRLAAMLPPGAQELVLYCDSALGRTYTMESTATLGPGATWQALGGTLAGTGAPIQWRAPLNGTALFYRVHVKY